MQERIYRPHLSLPSLPFLHQNLTVGRGGQWVRGWHTAGALAGSSGSVLA